MDRPRWQETLVLLFLYSSLGSSQLECDMFLAKSTIPHAGLGLYSAIDLKEGDSIGMGDVCIPILDLSKEDESSSLMTPFADYVWAGENMGMKMEMPVSTGLVEALCLGLDCAINCNIPLINVAKASPAYDEAGLHRSSSPGAGAITPYMNLTTRVTRDIPAGGELFKSYGNTWFETRDDFATLPLGRNYEQAHELLATMEELISSDSPVRHSLYEDVLLQIQSIWNTRTINALPPTYQQALVAMEFDIGLTLQPDATRTMDWLEQNGKCVDHIQWKQSLLPEAGHGAFAKRDLPSGTIITGTPIHHVPYRGTMDIYDTFLQELEDYEDWPTEGDGQIVGQQLLLNYCFGHPETTVLLCPYGVGVAFLNHNKSLANVKIVWADNGSLVHDSNCLDQGPAELSQHSTACLAMDYVATRDIQQGEELYLDYGDEWERSWLAHRSQWQPPGEAEYTNAHDWNKLYGNQPLRTGEEELAEPYPGNLQIRCHHNLLYRRSSMLWDEVDIGYPCSISERIEFEDEYIYDVVLTVEALDRWDPTDVPYNYGFAGIPREAIRFFDVPGTTDIHLTNAFREPIGLPDHMLPDTWRNVPRDETA